jgi:hypothetical protein
MQDKKESTRSNKRIITKSFTHSMLEIIVPSTEPHQGLDLIHALSTPSDPNPDHNQDHVLTQDQERTTTTTITIVTTIITIIIENEAQSSTHGTTIIITTITTTITTLTFPLVR